MMEAEWLGCEDPKVMLDSLQGRVSERKARLHGCACCRRRMRPNLFRLGWQAVEEAERFAEGRTAVSHHPHYFDHSYAHGVYAAAEAALLRDIVGNPFRPVGGGLAWLPPVIVSLAQAAYEERILPLGHLDPTRLAVLSDALEEAGCDDEAILSHLRSPGPHVRGCWALDMVLGKE